MTNDDSSQRRIIARPSEGPVDDDEIELLASAVTSRAMYLLAELPAEDRREFLLRKVFGALPDQTKH